ncbi:MAG: hypothetical protein BWY59_00127 [Verrucomicrobia bacterium ADurb.Bin345]|nr:MAG: hypothetical protein BWY59_00127 [Verrucomicrobia bacterium ADurb.Bin345]
MFVASGAGWQASLPGCDATTVTLPAPVNDRFVPATLPGPSVTANETSRPLDAVADRPTVPLAMNRLPLVGRKSVIACSSLKHVNALLRTVSPKLVENTRTSRRSALPMPATITTCVADWL